ncbi:hypothetical protein IH979_02030 [Patescibacteria group bacterium]|nr:hypothetical protein [Patescibacteria group bacterium]
MEKGVFGGVTPMGEGRERRAPIERIKERRKGEEETEEELTEMGVEARAEAGVRVREKEEAEALKEELAAPELDQKGFEDLKTAMAAEGYEIKMELSEYKDATEKLVDLRKRLDEARDKVAEDEGMGAKKFWRRLTGGSKELQTARANVQALEMETEGFEGMLESIRNFQALQESGAAGVEAAPAGSAGREARERMGRRGEEERERAARGGR